VFISWRVLLSNLRFYSAWFNSCLTNTSGRRLLHEASHDTCPSICQRPKMTSLLQIQATATGLMCSPNAFRTKRGAYEEGYTMRTETVVQYALKWYRSCCDVSWVPLRITVGSGLDDAIYWHILQSQSLIADQNQWLSKTRYIFLKDYECLLFHCDCLERRLSKVKLKVTLRLTVS
jgi:hypothetical protein